MRNIFLLFSLLAFIPSSLADAPDSLKALLEQVKKDRDLEKRQLFEREQIFRTTRDKQKQLLVNASQALQVAEQQNETLKSSYKTYEKTLSQKNDELSKQMGSLSELDGVVKQIASDLNSIIDASIVSAEKPERGEILDLLSSRKELPSLTELEELWLLAMDEMVESGRVVSFQGKVVTAAGNETEQNVTRIGVFNVVSEGRFLRSLAGTGKLIEPGRQPDKRYQDMARDLEGATSGIHAFPLDPTGGAMLALLVQEPTLKERIIQGGFIGYVIILVAIVGLLISIERFIMLYITAGQVRDQLEISVPGKNPLGRIMQVYKDNPDIGTETLELKLDEAILKELPRIQRGLSTIALLAAVSPLLGLLGTVTGIIETFQSITLYGTGDPRLMSGGISQALVTTVMGLLAAIPLLLLHGILASKRNTIVQILDEKSTAFVASLAETNRLKNNV